MVNVLLLLLLRVVLLVMEEPSVIAVALTAEEKGVLRVVALFVADEALEIWTVLHAVFRQLLYSLAQLEIGRRRRRLLQQLLLLRPGGVETPMPLRWLLRHRTCVAFVRGERKKEKQPKVPTLFLFFLLFFVC